jgi:hypothetical protein
MKILIVSNKGISKEVFNEKEREYHIPVIIDEQDEKECCYICVCYDKDHEDPSFLLFSDMKSEDLDYPFASEEMEIYIDMVNEYEKELII